MFGQESKLSQYTNTNVSEDKLGAIHLSPDSKVDPCGSNPLPDAKVDPVATHSLPDTKVDPVATHSLSDTKAVPTHPLPTPYSSSFVRINNDTAISKPRKRLSVLPNMLTNGNDSDLVENYSILTKKLNDIRHSLDLSLPQIVIVGSKDVGKSNLLECLVGREFLPKGSSATSTRRPTSVQMFNTQKEEYAIFSHKPGVKFFEFADVMSEIETETRRLPGVNGFSAEPISLEMYSPHVLNLKVVDLPGLIENEENSHTVEEIRNMILNHIRPENTLILAVMSATQKTSVALDIAKEVDKEGERTIGILTKLDELGDEADATDVLENRREYLKMGI